MKPAVLRGPQRLSARALRAGVAMRAAPAGFVAVLATATPAYAHGVHENASYLESGMAHALTTPHIAALIVALSAALGNEIVRRRAQVDGDEQSGQAIALCLRVFVAVAAGAVAGVILPPDWALSLYDWWPLAGLFTAAAALLLFPWMRGDWLALIGFVAGLLAAVGALLDGPADRDWGWFLVGVLAGGTIFGVQITALVTWWKPRWMATAARIAGAWCLTILSLQLVLTTVKPPGFDLRDGVSIDAEAPVSESLAD